VKAIEDLHRLGCAVPNPLGIEATPVATDDLDTGMRLQPLRDGRGRAIGEQIHYLMALEITHNRPKSSPSPPRPFVEPHHPWGRQGGQGGTMDQTQNCPTTPWHAQYAREPRTGTPANRYAHVPEGCTHAQTVAAPDRDEGRKPFGKNPPRTDRVPTEEATDLQMQDEL
jgi:hypothetical protein